MPVNAVELAMANLRPPSVNRPVRDQSTIQHAMSEPGMPSTDTMV
jgi:hypothetical protein